MSKKTLVISGLAITHVYFLLLSILQYLGISRALPMSTVAYLAKCGLQPAMVICFGVLLYRRFKTTGHKSRTLIGCCLFYIASLFVGGIFASGYTSLADAVTGTHWEFMRTIGTDQDMTSWMYMKFVLYLVPVSHLGNWGLFALLWFGSLDPRQPSKNQMLQFLKTGFQRSGKLSATT